MSPVCSTDWDMFWKGMYYVDTCRAQISTLPNQSVHRRPSLGHCHELPRQCNPLSPYQAVAGRDQCASSVQVTFSVCERLGIPVTFDKQEGPPTRITFMGIFLGSEARQLSTPPRQAGVHLAYSSILATRHKTTKLHKLFSLIGKLLFAAEVGHLPSLAKLHHHTLITMEARANFAGWAHFLWNGAAMLLDPGWCPHRRG